MKEPGTDGFVHLQSSIAITFLYHFLQFINMLSHNSKKRIEFNGSIYLISMKLSKFGKEGRKGTS